jgi:osmotically-inducible protein OsmY
MRETNMRSDDEIKTNVEAELKWCPEVDDTDIAVKVKDGVVTLTGYVSRLVEKYRAEGAIKRVIGVIAVANDIEVQPPAGEVTDPEIARRAVAALRNELPWSWQNIEPLVHQGRVALEGTVEWNVQREIAEKALHRIPGVISVRNSIRVEPRTAPTDIKRKIEAAFHRNAQIDANSVSVEARGAEVTLRGTVRSWAERDQALRVAWSAPGITRVQDEIVIRS